MSPLDGTENHWLDECLKPHPKVSDAGSFLQYDGRQLTTGVELEFELLLRNPVASAVSLDLDSASEWVRGGIRYEWSLLISWHE
ncbi:hypothetical protein LTR70_010694 [Exophiala xenobiotica]|uniref:Uncharacterized protein n=1 Tax=Lithohypha guttulata TaxID=1690604 RepID=A0ABR0JTF3_9EURO|nr:hypothetical protein LTR24_010621 [Lithohypha guttulata]KAK5308978.1 hypothetical protein LTR70_010694 [Exophiala xenobiotica]